MACACSAGRSSRRLRRCRTPLHDLENARQENSSARTRSVRALLVALRLRSGSGERGSLALVLRPTLRGVVRPTHLGAAGGELPEQAGLLGRVLHVGLLEPAVGQRERSEEHTSELQSLMRISYAVFCLKKKNTIT